MGDSNSYLYYVSVIVCLDAAFYQADNEYELGDSQGFRGDSKTNSPI